MGSVHSLDQFVDFLLTVAPGAALLVGMTLLLEALFRGRELDGPQEVVGLLEVRAAGSDLMDEVLNTNDSVFAQDFLNDAVVGQGDTSALNLAAATLVNEFGDGPSGEVAVSDKGLNSPKHVHRCFVKAHKYTVVELADAEQLHNLLCLGLNLVDTKLVSIYY